jgi:hypothetical protein
VPNPCARPNQQQFTSRLDRKSTCVDADNNRFGRRGNGASRISALFPAAAAKILSPPVVFFAEVEKHATRSLAQMQRKATLSATRTLVSEVSLHRTRMTATPSAPQRSGPEACMLHLRGLRLGQFRKGLGAAVRCDLDEGLFQGSCVAATAG